MILFRPIRQLCVAALLLSGPLVGSGMAAPAAPGGGGASQIDESGLASLMALRSELQRAELSILPLHQRRVTLQREAGELARNIDALKQRPAGVRRDLDLERALASSQTTTDQLERVQAELRWREPGVAALRRRVVRLIDGLLEAPTVSGRAALPDATRLELERLRTTMVALLVSPALPLQVARDRDAGIAHPLDGPRELREKADLLRDSGDKLRREARRIAGRIDGVERRRRLRERANALDEDMFGESTSSRRISRAQGTAVSANGANSRSADANKETATSGDASPQAPTEGAAAPPQSGGATNPGTNLGNGATGSQSGGSFTSPPPSRATESTVLRNLVDPATLDELRRADAIDDVDRQTRALKKAQAELETLASELDRRAKVLDGRAEEIKRQK